MDIGLRHKKMLQKHSGIGLCGHNNGISRKAKEKVEKLVWLVWTLPHIILFS